jgi:hypothetical protein
VDTEAQRLVTFLKESPAMHQLEAEREQALLAKRKEHAANRAELERMRDKTIPEKRAETAKARRHQQQCREKLNDAERELAHCVNDENAAVASFQSRINSIDGEIIKLAPPMVDEFKREMLRLFDETRFQTQDQTSPPHWFTGKRTTTTNTQTLEARLAAIRATLVKVDALKLEPLSQDEIVRRLEQLRRGVLQIDDVNDERRVAS